MPITAFQKQVLATIVSAACGKDPGFTPDLMLEMIQRHMTFTPDQLAAESLRKPVDPVQLKKDLLKLLEQSLHAPHHGSIRGSWPKVVD